jgi:hypothetical protein
MSMDPATRRLIEALHRSPVPYVLAVTGGGTGAAALLLDVPGGSRTVLEIVVPYSGAALQEFLGRSPEHYCSVETARAMAIRAYVCAGWLAPRTPVLGIACTASLASDRPKKGDHRFHVAVHDGLRTVTWSLTLAKGARDREGEEAVLDAVILNALAGALGVAERMDIHLNPDEELRTESFSASQLLPAQNSAVCVRPDGQIATGPAKPTLVLPGSFNPIHAGHWGLADVAERLTGNPAAFEISITNVDKPPLAPEELSHRLAQFAWRAPVWLTQAPTFAEKAALFPGATFVVGGDTAERIVDPRYYGDSAERVKEALEVIRTNCCRFLVAGRVDATGRFRSCAELTIPAEFRNLFVPIAESDFRFDISSTELRGRPE